MQNSETVLLIDNRAAHSLGFLEHLIAHVNSLQAHFTHRVFHAREVLLAVDCACCSGSDSADRPATNDISDSFFAPSMSSLNV
jgi:hypothetical protein